MKTTILYAHDHYIHRHLKIKIVVLINYGRKALIFSLLVFVGESETFIEDFLRSFGSMGITFS